MENSWILLGSAVVLFVVLVMSRRERECRNREHAAALERLRKAIGNSAFIGQRCFASLEWMQKSLETLRARTENEEQRLCGMVGHPDVAAAEQYTAAALMLSKGQKPERVATLLRLPLDQVRLVQELGGLTARVKKGRGQRQADPQTARLEKNRVEASAPQPRKRAVEPILLTDVVSKGPVDLAPQSGSARRDDAAA